MTDNTQTEALLPSRETLMAQAQVFASAWAIAGSRFDTGDGMKVAEQEKAILADMTRRLHAHIAELEAQLEAVGAGGVNGPLMGQSQAMPDISALTERGAQAWAGVDAQGLREGRWYMVTHDGVATLCADEADAEREAADAQAIWPGMGPHRAVQLVDAGRASISANAGGPTCDMRTVVAVAVTMLYDTHPEDVCRVFDRNDLETIVSITEPLGHGRVEDIYRDAWDHVAAPPTAQAEGWRDIATAPKDGVFLVYMQDEVRPARRMQVADWHSNVKIVGGLFSFDCATVTHWMPLPPPPTSAEGVEHG